MFFTGNKNILFYSTLFYSYLIFTQQIQKTTPWQIHMNNGEQRTFNTTYSNSRTNLQKCPWKDANKSIPEVPLTWKHFNWSLTQLCKNILDKCYINPRTISVQQTQLSYSSISIIEEDGGAHCPKNNLNLCIKTKRVTAYASDATICICPAFVWPRNRTCRYENSMYWIVFHCICFNRDSLGFYAEIQVICGWCMHG